MKKKKPEIQKGQFWTIDNKLFRGHKGRVSKKKKDGTYEAVCLTHSKKSFSRSNIPLKENPSLNNKDEPAYVLKRPLEAKTEHFAKYHSKMKVTNNHDKAIFRNVAKRKPRKLK